MNKKGFTLIELLAVILVIGIVAVITVPIVKGSINNAKEKTLMKQTSSIIESAKSWAVKNTDKLLGDGVSILVKVDTLKKEGYLENKTITDPVDNVEMNGCVDIKYNASYNQYVYEYRSSCEYKAIFTVADGETSIPACITNNTWCDVEKAGDDGIKVGVQVNASDKYDFYVMSDDTKNRKLTLIMDQNLDETVAWASKDDYLEAGGTESDWNSECTDCGNNNKGPVTALKELEKRTSNWTNIPRETYILTDDYETPHYSPMTITARARLITETEAEDFGCKGSNDSCPTWLVGNLSNSGAPYGYWTSTSQGYVQMARSVTDGQLYYELLRIANSYGIRPVITIPKTATIY